MNANSHLSMRNISISVVLIYQELTCTMEPTGVQLIPKMTNLKVLGSAKVDVQEVSDIIFSLNSLNFIDILLIFTVLRTSSGTACNVFGTSELSNNTCQCKQGYIGGRCERCTLYAINRLNGTNGHIDNVTGEGVRCSSKFAA